MLPRRFLSMQKVLGVLLVLTSLFPLPSLLLALVLGYASWHLVEKHGIALGQRAHAWWSHRRGARGR